MTDRVKVYNVQHESAQIAAKSAMWALSQAVGGETILIPSNRWAILFGLSWTLGDAARRFCARRMGSDFTLCVPIWDDVRIFLRAGLKKRCIIHFLWGEMSSPYLAHLYRTSAASVIGTFHATPSRQRSSLIHTRWLDVYDRIVVVSSCQIPFFLERGYPENRISVIPLGIDTQLFSPDKPPLTIRKKNVSLVCGCVGKTERDHIFLADIVRAAPPGLFKLQVLTTSEQFQYYDGLDDVELLPRLSDADLLEFYRKMDVVLLPMRDCTANNALLESMACGTPVLINDVGGANEYVPPGYLMPSGDCSAWLNRLLEYSKNPEKLAADGLEVRKWAEKFDWTLIAPLYREIYEQIQEAR
ncbi:MAG: glycosyltransferase family 1 protein [Bacteroidia bacterium]|nr:glycosyltransferase family 1 protein [Bacteroidia bacterium]